MNVVVATLDIGSYEITAVGYDEADAKDAAKRGAEQHVAQWGEELREDWDEYYGLNLNTVAIGNHFTR